MKNNHEAGFTLVELLIATLLIGIISLGIFQTLRVSINSLKQNQQINASFQNANMSLAMIVRELRGGKNFNISSNSQSITFENQDGDTITYSLSSDNLFRSVNGPQTLLAENVTNFQVTQPVTGLYTINLTINVGGYIVQLQDSVKPRNLNSNIVF